MELVSKFKINGSTHKDFNKKRRKLVDDDDIEVVLMYCTVVVYSKMSLGKEASMTQNSRISKNTMSKNSKANKLH